ncbi:hypothetical protein GGR52DRAFT_197723 [Hypoxylon sp. FL1284]|nr:hypothetical protein GGR52DRAFT_197723 [Hypoxylon sp. FL1284]
MYIPQTNPLRPDFALASASGAEDGPLPALESPRHHTFLPIFEAISSVARRTFGRGLGAYSTALDRASGLRKRASADNVNTTIGAVVGVLLAVFLLGFFAFLYFYGRSIRIKRKKHRRHRSSGSRGSKNEEASGGAGDGGEPPAPA